MQGEALVLHTSAPLGNDKKGLDNTGKVKLRIYQEGIDHDMGYHAQGDLREYTGSTLYFVAITDRLCLYNQRFCVCGQIQAGVRGLLERDEQEFLRTG